MKRPTYYGLLPNRAEQGGGADALQRPLRSRFRARLTAGVRHRRQRPKHSGYHRAAVDLSTYIWTEYLQHRARSRGFDLAIIEHILRFSHERYFDTVTQRMVAVGRHGHRLVMVPYDQEKIELLQSQFMQQRVNSSIFA